MNATPQNAESVGYLIVKVTTARGAIPLEGASVNIRGGDAENSGVLYSLRTNRDGQTQKVTLPTPPRSASETPTNITPYANYNVDVFLDGYVPLSFQNVPIFPSIVSIQPAVMVPAPESYGTGPIYVTPSTVLPENPETDLN
ncbi:MAG: hypothetical protein IJX94_00895 [Clostridia bacterium]|nr:hypothetical protein [Clostridia bacterium]